MPLSETRLNFRLPKSARVRHWTARSGRQGEASKPTSGGCALFSRGDVRVAACVVRAPGRPGIAGALAVRRGGCDAPPLLWRRVPGLQRLRVLAAARPAAQSASARPQTASPEGVRSAAASCSPGCESQHPSGWGRAPLPSLQWFLRHHIYGGFWRRTAHLQTAADSGTGRRPSHLTTTEAGATFADAQARRVATGCVCVLVLEARLRTEDISLPRCVCVCVLEDGRVEGRCSPSRWSVSGRNAQKVELRQFTDSQTSGRMVCLFCWWKSLSQSRIERLGCVNLFQNDYLKMLPQS